MKLGREARKGRLPQTRKNRRLLGECLALNFKDKEELSRRRKRGKDVEREAVWLELRECARVCGGLSERQGTFGIRVTHSQTQSQQ